MSALRWGRLVSAALDPLLVPAGFSRGQYGEGGDDREGGAQIIYCAAHDRFSDRHPRLPQANAQEPGGTCVDLVVEVGADGTLGRLDLEGISLEDTLGHVGLPADCEAVAGLRGRSVPQCLPVLAGVLRRLFDDRGEHMRAPAPEPD